MSVTVENYLNSLPEERQVPMRHLCDIISENLPDGFSQGISYSMIGWAVPHSLYPPGYHCDPKQPLPFLSIASQKNFIALYHMGIYADKELLDWFTAEYPLHAKTKLDMGKSCIRFKKMEDIPFKLISELCRKMTPEAWIEKYEKVIKR